MSNTNLTKQEAIDLAATRWWEQASPEQILEFQLFEHRLCMDMDPLYAAARTVLGRLVWTHEFGSEGIAVLQAEYMAIMRERSESS